MHLEKAERRSVNVSLRGGKEHLLKVTGTSSFPKLKILVYNRKDKVHMLARICLVMSSSARGSKRGNIVTSYIFRKQSVSMAQEKNAW